MAYAGGDDLPPVPPPTKLADELPERRHPLPQNHTSSGGYAGMEGVMDEIRRRLDKCFAEICMLQTKQDDLWSMVGATSKKRDELDTKHRNQIDCISDRIFDAEKQLSEAQKWQDEALRAANTAFQHERENLMSVIDQVNCNFDHLKGELANCSSEIKGMEMKILEQFSIGGHFAIEPVWMKLNSLSGDVSQLHMRFDTLGDQADLQQNVQELADLLQNQQARTSCLESCIQEQKMHIDRTVNPVAAECADSRNRLRHLGEQVEGVRGTFSDMLNRVSSTETLLGVVLQKMAEQDEQAARGSRASAPEMRGPLCPPFAMPFARDERSDDSGQESADVVNFAWSGPQQGKGNVNMPRRPAPEHQLHDVLEGHPRQAAAWDEVALPSHPLEQELWGSPNPPRMDQRGRRSQHFVVPDASALPNVALRL
jgi:predicted  nucleic acid-binding Zn-ribbon protein